MMIKLQRIERTKNKIATSHASDQASDVEYILACSIDAPMRVSAEAEQNYSTFLRAITIMINKQQRRMTRFSITTSCIVKPLSVKDTK